MLCRPRGRIISHNTACGLAFGRHGLEQLCRGGGGPRTVLCVVGEKCGDGASASQGGVEGRDGLEALVGKLFHISSSSPPVDKHVGQCQVIRLVDQEASEWLNSDSAQGSRHMRLLDSSRHEIR